MHITRRSLLFIFLLISIVVFFVGLHVGKQIQKMDRSYVPPIIQPTTTPTNTPEPTKKPASIKSFLLKGCGVSFLIPDGLENVSTASQEADLQNATDHVFVTCDQAFIRDQQRDVMTKAASQSAKIADQNTKIFSTKTGTLWTLRNTDRNLVLFDASPGLVQLVQETLKML